MTRNVIFFGFGKLGMECLDRLIKEKYNIMYILTHKEGLSESVDTFAKINNIKCSYKDMRSDNEFKNKILGETKIDYIISINYRYILSKEVFSIAKHAINIHGSLLPKYRGRSPHVWSIINGEEYSGVTCHLINEGIDTGNIIKQTKIKIEENDTGSSLLQKFQLVYPEILIDSLQRLEKRYKTTIQNERYASYYGKRTPDMGYIDFHKSKFQIINFVRAQAHPYPGAYYYLSNGSKIIINLLEIEENKNIQIEQIGSIKLINNNYYVRCLDGILKLIDFNIVN